VISTGGGVTASENVHTNEGGSDFSVSIDQLEELLPNVQRVALVPLISRKPTPSPAWA
jgi:hypothetical protein